MRGVLPLDDGLHHDNHRGVGAEGTQKYAAKQTANPISLQVGDERCLVIGLGVSVRGFEFLGLGFWVWRSGIGGPGLA